MPTGAHTPASSTPFFVAAQTPPGGQTEATTPPLQRADSMERACVYALKGGLYELKGASKHKLPIKAAWAASSAVQGFRKGYAEPAPRAGSDLAPPGLESLSLSESPPRTSSGVLRAHSSASVNAPPRTHSGTSINGMVRSSSGGGLHHSMSSSGSVNGLGRSSSSGGLHHGMGSSGSVNGLLRSSSSGGLHHSMSSSGSVNGLSRSSSSGGLHHSMSSGNLCALSRGASSHRVTELSRGLSSSANLVALSHSSSSESLHDSTRSVLPHSVLPHSSSSDGAHGSARSGALRSAGSGGLANGRLCVPMGPFKLGPVHEAEEDFHAEGRPRSADRPEHGKARRRSIDRRERAHPYAAAWRRHTFIAPYHSDRLSVPEQPATYPLHVSFGGLDPRAVAAATRLTVAHGAPLTVGVDARRLPATLRAAPRGELTLHNHSCAHVLVRLGEAPLEEPSQAAARAPS